MAVFRFRAAAALAWRLRLEEAAAAHLARAEAALRAAIDDRDAASAALAAARTVAADRTRDGIDGATLGWHRNWIVSRAAAMTAREADVAARTADVTAARAAWHDARRRRLALERVRDRALRRFRQEQDRIEMKMLDEMARLRFLAAAGDREQGDSL